LINALSVSLWVTGTLPTPLVGLWLIRDVGLVTATWMYVKRAQKDATVDLLDPVHSPIHIQPTTISKVNTALQFVTLAAGIVVQQPAEAGSTLAFLADPVVPALCWITGGTTVASALSYVGHSAFSNKQPSTPISGNPSEKRTPEEDRDKGKHG
jgi:hypothetical protein